MKKILITAFGAFAGNEENYSTKALRLAELPDNAKKEYIPVGFEVSPEHVEKLVLSDEYEAVILVGEAGARERVTVEKIAINWKEATIADNYGVMPRGERLCEGAPDGIFSNVDIRELVLWMKEKGVDVSTSFSAGTFVCNALYWAILRAFPEKKVVFIHVPRKNEENSARALEVAVDYLS